MAAIEKGRLSLKQIFAILVLSRILEALTFLPIIGAGSYGGNAGRDVWISMLLAMPMSLSAMGLILYLGNKHKGKTLIEYMQTLLGSLPGRILGLLYIWFFLQSAAMVLRDIGELFTNTVMIETPILVLIIAVSVIVIVVVRGGPETIGRMSELILPIVLISLLLVSIFILPEVDIRYFLPVMAGGMNPVFISALYALSRQTELLIFAMTLPYISNKTKAIWYAAAAVVFSNSLIVLVIIIVGGVFTISQADTHVVFEFFSVLRLISIGDFLERIDAIALAVWMGAGVIRASAFIYCTVLGSSQVFCLKDYRSSIVPLLSMAVPLSILLYDNTREQAEYVGGSDGPYSLFFLVVIPVFLLFVHIIKSAWNKHKSG